MTCLHCRHEAPNKQSLVLKSKNLQMRVAKSNFIPTSTNAKDWYFFSQVDLDDMEDFTANLLEQCDVKCVEKAVFIRTNPGASAYIVTFNSETTPYTLYIPGELSDTVINPYISRPMLCKKCFSYGHTEKRCTSETITCKRCSNKGHERKDCTEASP